MFVIVIYCMAVSIDVEMNTATVYCQHVMKYNIMSKLLIILCNQRVANTNNTGFAYTALSTLVLVLLCTYIKDRIQTTYSYLSFKKCK